MEAIKASTRRLWDDSAGRDFLERSRLYVDRLLATEMHGRARRLLYASPVTGEVVIFDHDPF